MLRKIFVIPVLCALLFGCVGPPIGSLAISVPHILSPVFTQTPWSQVVDPIGTISIAAFFSYLYGFIPAFCTGIVAGLILPRLRPSVFVASCSAIGFVFAFAYAATWDNNKNAFAYIPFWNIMERMALPGLIGGSVSGALATAFFRAEVRNTSQSA